MSTPQHSGPKPTDYVIKGRDDEIVGFHGTFLGFATSQRDAHDRTVEHTPRDDGGLFAQAGTRCSACRWFEVQIYRVNDEFVFSTNETVTVNTDVSDCPLTERRGRYLVVTSGVSAVPGEVIMRRASWTDSPYEVVELLTQRRGARPFLPAPSARVLSQAAAWDAGIRSAYIDRAVI